MDRQLANLEAVQPVADPKPATLASTGPAYSNLQQLEEELEGKRRGKSAGLKPQYIPSQPVNQPARQRPRGRGRGRGKCAATSNI